MNSKPRYSPRRPVRTMKELAAEKQRIQREIDRTGADIRKDYNDVTEALTFRNLINTVAEEIIAANLVVSQAYAIIRPLFGKRKKKKKALDE